MQYEIKEEQGIRYLYSNETATQSAISVDQPHKIVMRNLEYLMGCLMFIDPPKNILMLGVGGGSLIHFFRHYLPQCHITGVDIDGELIEQMQQQFLLPKADDLLTYHVADAEQWVKQNTATYDLIIVDVFSESYMPDWVLSKAFMQRIKQSLSEQGAVAWNLLISSDHVFTEFYSHLRQTFQQRTLCLAAEDYENTLAYSFNFDLKQRDMGYLIELAALASATYELNGHEIIAVLFNTNPIDSGFI